MYFAGAGVPSFQQVQAADKATPVISAFRAFLTFADIDEPGIFETGSRFFLPAGFIPFRLTLIKGAPILARILSGRQDANSHQRSRLMQKAMFLLQTGLVLIAIGVAFFLAGKAGALAATYGGVVALANTRMLGNRVQRLSTVDANSAQRGMVMMYVSAVVRFVFILVALAVGLGLLKLLPLPLIATFVGAQVVFMAASMRMSSGQ